jgi:hypothetical protein
MMVFANKVICDYLFVYTVFNVMSVMGVKSKVGLRGSHSRIFLVVSLIVIVLLVSSLLVYPLLMTDKSQVHVKNEVELRAAVDNAKFKVPVNIILDGDISLTDCALVIPCDKNITLSSNGDTDFFKLIGASRYPTITVEGSTFKKGGELRINGIIVTHSEDDTDNGEVDVSGVTVGRNGIFILITGEISNNIGKGGCGVNNYGTFEMYGGMISGNIATYYGGGVYNYFVFKMFGGEIINNIAGAGGGGVYSNGAFELSSGIISGNIARQGGGVYYFRDMFNRLGGEIFNNNADMGKDVYLFGDS